MPRLRETGRASGLVSVRCASLLFLVALAAPAMSVAISPSVPSPAPVGAVVTWTATVTDAQPENTLWYRFQTRRIGEDARVARDYGPANSLDWTASEHEGAYEILVSVRNLDTAEESSSSALFEMTSRVTGDTPVINATANSLVFLYSAPPCAAGSRMRVQFQSPAGFVQNTNYKPCRAGLSMNFYLAGMRANTAYSVKHTIDTGSQFVDGPALSMTTPVVSFKIAPYVVLQAPPDASSTGVLLQSSLSQPILATDLSGNLLWYYPGSAPPVSFLTQPEAGGLFLGLYWDQKLDASQQVLREFDLTGTAVRETNAARISEQLVAMGMRPITSFHHDARRLPDGRILTLGSVEQMLTDIQGDGDVDVVADVILVLDQDLQVVWAWDAFDHLNASRVAVLNETCVNGQGGCAPFFGADHANDWLHGNSVQLTPDGNILYSARHQDWLIKIDYSNGLGSGNVLWRLGKDGDFQFASPDPYPWFSHQHDANFLPGDNLTLVVFDNGNTRRSLDSNANSRGQVIQLDEQNRVAKLALNVDLGVYSIALGTAQLLPNGNYSFLAGWVQNPDRCQVIEVDASGKIVYAIEAATQIYRTFRMRDLYTP